MSMLSQWRFSVREATTFGQEMGIRRRWSSFQLGAPRAVRDAGAGNASGRQMTHLVVLVNGVNGHPSNWTQLLEQTERVPDMGHMCFRPSVVNAKKATFAGIDTCGDRLVSELRDMVGERQHGFTEISFIGHSMGGLIARYAIGKLFDTSSSSILGLRPRHFITLATPHLGCDVDGLAQVPMLGWAGDLPVIGPNLRRAIFGAAAPVTASLLGRSGEQLFLQDGANGQGTLPLLLRMSGDSEGEAPFMSALASFSTHTLYANVTGDQVVGWANSSLRFADELPEPPAKGVRLCEPSPSTSPCPSYLHLPSAPGFPASHITSFPLDCGDLSDSSSACSISSECSSVDSASGPSSSNGSGKAASVPLLGGLLGRFQAARKLHLAAGGGAKAPTSTMRVDTHVNEDVATMLLRLQAIPWRRVDVCYHEKKTHFMAHNHIQVTRKWLNRSGLPTLTHLVELLAEMETTARAEKVAAIEDEKDSEAKLV